MADKCSAKHISMTYTAYDHDAAVDNQAGVTGIWARQSLFPSSYTDNIIAVECQRHFKNIPGLIYNHIPSYLLNALVDGELCPGRLQRRSWF